MKKWENKLNSFVKARSPIKSHEEMLTFPGYKGNANQNHVKTPPYSS
jgi:predicted  nucleic acid-binding Zn ribbon protein